MRQGNMKYPRNIISLRSILYVLFIMPLLAACSLEPADSLQDAEPTRTDDRYLVLCEGLWGLDNSTISYVAMGEVTNCWFQKNNPKMHLGDTGNDIIQVNDTLIAISVNWSNIIQYIRPDGRAIAATENIPNNRRLASDGNGFLYCTSYADDGYVAKIDIRTKEIVDTCHVGREPEGVAYYDGKLFIANTGGYGPQTGRPYETTISVVDAATMRELKRIDTGCINLYGAMVRSGQFLCINSAGDNYDVPSRTVVLNMASEEFRVFDFSATYACAYSNRFYILGSGFSYLTGDYQMSTHTVSLPSMTAADGLGAYSAAQQEIENMQTPYGIFISPYSAHMYVTDARGNATNGRVYEFSPSGERLNSFRLEGINPGKILFME